MDVFRLRIWAFVVPSILLAQNSVPAQTREEVATWMEHQRLLVRTMECEYVEALVAYRDQKPYPYYTRNYHWWWKGGKERFDHTQPGSNYFEKRAFDGNVYRSVGRPGETQQLSATINTLKSSRLRDSFRNEPYDLFFQCCAIPYSEVVARGRDFAVSRMDVKGVPHLRVSVRPPPLPPPFFDRPGPRHTITFDPQQRIVEMAYADSSTKTRKEVTLWTTTFSEFRAHLDTSGETIWWPGRAVMTAYADPLPDGRLAPIQTTTITFKHVQFNHPIADEQFVLPLPPDAAIYDGLTGRHILPGNGGFPTWDNPPDIRPWTIWSWVWRFAGGSAVLATLLVAFWWWRKRSATAASTGSSPK